VPVPTTLIQRAREKLADPKHWTKHTSARDLHNLPVDYTDPDACRFCIIGALAASTGKPGEYHAAHKIMSKLVPSHYGRRLSAFNDAENTQHADVLALFDRAIAS
jgi:hypothetical protein